MTTIQLNGDPYELPGPATIADLLARLEIDPRRVAVERNFVVVKRDRYATTAIAAGDQIEIVNFVGGGSAHAGGTRRNTRTSTPSTENGSPAAP